MPYLQARKTPVRLTRMVLSQMSRGVSTGPSSAASTMPALLNMTSIPPKAAAARSSKASQEAASAMSPSSATARPPAAAILATTASAASLRMSAAITAAPSAANLRAVASPMPPPAPLTKARLPFMRMFRSCLARCQTRCVSVLPGGKTVASRDIDVEPARLLGLAFARLANPQSTRRRSNDGPYRGTCFMAKAAKTKDAISQQVAKLRAEGIAFVRFELPDLHAISRSKLIPIDAVEGYARKGLNFYGGILGLDTASNVISGTGLNEEINYGDSKLYPDFSTL